MLYLCYWCNLQEFIFEPKAHFFCVKLFPYLDDCPMWGALIVANIAQTMRDKGQGVNAASAQNNQADDC